MDLRWLSDSPAHMHSPDAQRRWARRLFDLPEDAPADDARLALVGRLADASFVPDEDWQEAAWVLEDEALGITSEPGKQFRFDRQRELKKNVAAFAEEFFRLDPATRNERRNELVQQVPPGALAAWLELLKPGVGLKVESLPIENSAFHATLAAIRELFVLLPPDRARRRRQLVEELDYTAKELETALTLLRAHCADWLELAPDFTAALARSRLRSSASFSEIVADYRSKLPAGTSTAGSRVRRAWWGDREPAAKTHTTGGGSFDARAWLFILPLVFMVARLFLSVGGTSPRDVPRPQRLQQWETLSPHLQDPLQHVADPSRRKPPEIKLPLDSEGNIEIVPPAGATTDDKAREALSRLLGLPADKVRFKYVPRPEATGPEGTASDQGDAP